MIIELAEKKVVDIVRDNLDKFKKIDDESIKDVVVQIEDAIKKYDSLITNDVEVSPDNDSNVDIKEKEPEEKEQKNKESDKQETTNNNIKTEDKKVDTKDNETVVEDTKIVAGDVQLSMEVASKLREAALELDNKDSEIQSIQLELSARNEIIGGYKNTVIELNKTIENIQSELDVYKKREEIELNKQKKQITLDLIELYANLNMSKSLDDFKAFGLSQLVDLRKALEVTLEKKNTPVRETRNSSAVKFVKQPNKDNSTPDETFEGLFGKNPDMY